MRHLPECWRTLRLPSFAGPAFGRAPFGGYMSVNLQQGKAGQILERRNDGVTDYVTDDFRLFREQDVTDILRLNKAARDRDHFKGFRFAPTFRRVASIPVAAVDIAKAQGLDILNDPDDMRKFLNDPRNKAFRTTNEVV